MKCSKIVLGDSALSEIAAGPRTYVCDEEAVYEITGGTATVVTRYGNRQPDHRPNTSLRDSPVLPYHMPPAAWGDLCVIPYRRDPEETPLAGLWCHRGTARVWERELPGFSSVALGISEAGIIHWVVERDDAYFALGMYPDGQECWRIPLPLRGREEVLCIPLKKSVLLAFRGRTQRGCLYFLEVADEGTLSVPYPMNFGEGGDGRHYHIDMQKNEQGVFLTVSCVVPSQVYFMPYGPDGLLAGTAHCILEAAELQELHRVTPAMMLRGEGPVMVYNLGVNGERCAIQRVHIAPGGKGLFVETASFTDGAFRDWQEIFSDANNEKGLIFYGGHPVVTKSGAVAMLFYPSQLGIYQYGEWTFRRVFGDPYSLTCYEDTVYLVEYRSGHYQVLMIQL